MRFAGYAAIFGRPDRGGDVVRAGAFARCLERPATVPLLWQHAPGRPIGRVEYLKEDRRGLRVIGRLSEGTAGREAAGAGPRELTDLELVEISLVTLPMQPKARVHVWDI